MGLLADVILITIHISCMKRTPSPIWQRHQCLVGVTYVCLSQSAMDLSRNGFTGRSPKTTCTDTGPVFVIFSGRCHRRGFCHPITFPICDFIRQPRQLRLEGITCLWTTPGLHVHVECSTTDSHVILLCSMIILITEVAW